MRRVNADRQPGSNTARAPDVADAAGRQDLAGLVEHYRTAVPSDRAAAFKSLLAEFKSAGQAGRFDELVPALRAVLTPDLDYTSLQALHRLHKSLPPKETTGKALKLAVLGGFTTHQLKDFIETYLFAAGLSCEIYEADYGLFRQEILDPTSHLYEFKPDRVFMATNWRNLGYLPALSDDPQRVADLMDREYHDWATLWQVAHQRLDCQILQNNFDVPPWTSLGNYESRHPAALATYVAGLNRLFAERAPPYVTIHDVDRLAADIGRRAWGDQRFFLQAKLPCAPEYLVNYAYNVSSIMAAEHGRSRKCLVLDLDNTLWGGVIGDDGLGGIRVSQGDAEGEGFLAFQTYVKALKARGVILAVCSKNDEKIAREVFEKHPDMVLKLDDISLFMANWNDKASNLRAIALQLNIGIDSLVFVDDNPAERAIVRRLVPEVAVPEVTTDPVEFIEILERHQYFQVASLGAEDFKRSEYYRTNAMRATIESSAANIDDFLASLDMQAAIGPVTPQNLERATQLINKSNQFNLTTRRRSSAEVMALMNDPTWLTVTAQLSDRFGDNGLVSVVLAHSVGNSLEIDTWLMSCRVLKRGLEQSVLNHLCELAIKQGLSRLRGEYMPTSKNDLVREHYPNLGFISIGAEPDGRTSWELPLAERKPIKTFIKMAAET